MSRRMRPDTCALVVGVGLVILALAYRLILLRATMTTVDSDQAVSGIMSRHILQGDRPVFFYGQNYNGALEAYLTAAIFRLFGPTDLTLRLVPTVLSVVLVVQLYALARRLYGMRIAVASALWLAVPPPVLAFWGTAAGAGYIDVTTFGTGLLAIAVRRWGLGQPRRYDVAALGLLAGLGVWAQPMIAPYLATLAVVSVPRVWRRRTQAARQLRGAWPGALGFVVGASPWLVVALHRGSAVLAVLDTGSARAALPTVILRLVDQAFPVLLGGAAPIGPADQFAAYLRLHAIPYVLTALALAYLLVRVLVSPHGLVVQTRAYVRGRPCPDAALAVLPLAVLGAYLASRFTALSWTTRNPRYLLPLYTSVPFVLACAVPRGAWGTHPPERWHTWRGPAALGGPALTLGLAVGLALNIYGAAQYRTQPSGALPDLAPLIAMLEAHHDSAVYADYWIAWRLAFDSGERLTPVVTLGLAIDHNARGARYAPYFGRAARAARWAYILPDRYVGAFVTLLRRSHIPYRRWRWGTSAVFYNHWDWGRPNVFDGPVRPGCPLILAAPVRQRVT